MWAFVVSIVPLILLLFQEFFSAQARARQANEKFQLDQAQLKQIVDAAMEKWIAQNASASAGAGSAWDNADGEIKKGEDGTPPQSNN